MTAPEKAKLLHEAAQRLKQAANFADVLKDCPVRAESISTLERLSADAHKAVVALKAAFI